MKDSNSEAKSDVISGRNPVSEAIRSGRPIDKILVARGEKSGAVVGILAKARDRQIPVKEVDRAKLDYIISDKQAVFSPNSVLVGSPNLPTVVPKDARI